MTNEHPLVIADSSALVSLFVPQDSNHEKAHAIAQRLREQSATVVIPSEVFVETINVLGRKLAHGDAVAAAAFLSESGYFALTHSTDAIWRSALTRFTTLPASDSFTDCVVMVVADEHHTSTIFGFDDVFRGNGYRLPTLPERAT